MSANARVGARAKVARGSSDGLVADSRRVVDSTSISAGLGIVSARVDVRGRVVHAVGRVRVVGRVDGRISASASVRVGVGVVAGVGVGAVARVRTSVGGRGRGSRASRAGDRLP